MNRLKQWMDAASGPEQEELARRAATSRQYLYRLAAPGDLLYAREARPALAAAIEEATALMHRESKGRLPRVYRTDLNSACRGCAFAAKCLGNAIVPAEFKVINDGDEGNSAD